MQGLNFLLSQQGSGTVKGLYITPLIIKYFRSTGQNHLDKSLLGKGTICDYFPSFTAMESHTLFFMLHPRQGKMSVKYREECM